MDLFTTMAEGDVLRAWLDEWDLGKYEQKIREQGIKSPNDFKYIKSKAQFDELVLKLGDVQWMDVLKLQDAWSTKVPTTLQQPAPQIHFLGDEEKKILDALSRRYVDVSNDIDAVQKANNGTNSWLYFIHLSL